MRLSSGGGGGGGWRWLRRSGLRFEGRCSGRLVVRCRSLCVVVVQYGPTVGRDI